VVIGMNSIAAYLIRAPFENFFMSSFRIHLGEHFFQFLARAWSLCCGHGRVCWLLDHSFLNVSPELFPEI